MFNVAEWIASGIVGAVVGALLHAVWVRYRTTMIFVHKRVARTGVGAAFERAEFRMLQWLWYAIGLVQAIDPPMQRWAGQYKKVSGFPGQVANNRRLDTLARQVLASPASWPRVLSTNASAQTRDLLRALHHQLNGGKEAFYFDCTAVSPADLKMRFLHNIASYSGAIVTRNNVTWHDAIHVNDFDMRAFKAFLRRMSKPRSSHWGFIIHEINDLLVDDPNSALAALLADIAAEIRGHECPLVASMRSDGPGVLEAEQLFGAHTITLSTPPDTADLSHINALVADTTISFPSATLDEASAVPCDVVPVLLLLLRHKLADSEEVARVLRLTAPNQLATAILDLTLRKIRDESVRDFGPEGYPIHGPVAALAMFPCPVPMGTVRKLWYDPQVFPEMYSVRDPEAGLGEPWLLKRLIATGVAERLVPKGDLIDKPLYALRPGFRLSARQLLAPDSKVAQGAEEHVKRLLDDIQPPGTTPLSRYLSQADFRAVDALLLTAADDGSFELRLPVQLCSIISAVRRGTHTPRISLREYNWISRSGAQATDIMAVISPSEWGKWDLVKRIRVHIVSREGSGRSVQKVLAPFVAQVFDIQGDEYRCGPGGYYETMVVLREPDELLADRQIPEDFKGKLRKSHAVSEALAWWLERQLRAGVDDLAVVLVLDCTPLDVVREFTERTEEVEGSISVIDADPEPYGPVSTYSVRFDNAASDWMRAQLLSDSAIEPSGLVARAFYSPTSLQIFLFFRELNLERHVRALVGPAGRETAGKHAVMTFLHIADANKLNLLAVRHGPGSGYFVEVEIPKGVGAPVPARDIRAYRAALISELKRSSQEHGIAFHPIGGVPEDAIVEYESQSKGRKRFPGAIEWTPRDAYDLVSRPDFYHRYMRKHLFIPDADAAITAFVQERASRSDRILEIGCGTGALTEKLLLAGYTNLEIVEPDERMLNYWIARSESRYQHTVRYTRGELEALNSSDVGLFDLLVSQGVHHHIGPEVDGFNGDYRLEFLRLCRNLLQPGGWYVLGDEFLANYSSPADRIQLLDRWYSRVISAAIADGHPELAYLEYGFWLNDRTGAIEHKESLEAFRARLAACADPPFEVVSEITFGIDAVNPGGFAVLLLRAR